MNRGFFLINAEMFWSEFLREYFWIMYKVFIATLSVFGRIG